MQDMSQIYVIARLAWTRSRDDDPDTGEEQVVVFDEHGAFASRQPAEEKAAKLNEAWLQEQMRLEGVETLEALTAKIGRRRVATEQRRYFVREMELNEDEVSRQERLEKDLLAFVNELIHGPGASQVYIAVMENSEGTYDLEVEVDPGTIGGMFATGTSDLERARSVADLLDALLKDRNITVFPTREEWEAARDED